MSRRPYSDAQRGGNETLRDGARSDGLDLFDVIALAWSERGFIAIVFAVLFAIGVAGANDTATRKTNAMIAAASSEGDIAKNWSTNFTNISSTVNRIFGT